MSVMGAALPSIFCMLRGCIFTVEKLDWVVFCEVKTLLFIIVCANLTLTNSEGMEQF